HQSGRNGAGLGGYNAALPDAFRASTLPVHVLAVGRVSQWGPLAAPTGHEPAVTSMRCVSAG
ncbi:hypothetical protein, partial [Mesorhizobium sp. M1A.F.Ca.ET.072.01.1.1]|uniref:hypothetical protein n=1 Tax=Mesorhizobium sp. M1A.F.Ca.ET.072.01.1.1 TaxID=2496753 RepID=UPI001AECE191